MNYCFVLTLSSNAQKPERQNESLNIRIRYIASLTDRNLACFEKNYLIKNAAITMNKI